jgi:hypothetical protein
LHLGCLPLDHSQLTRCLRSLLWPAGIQRTAVHLRQILPRGLQFRDLILDVPGQDNGVGLALAQGLQPVQVLLIGPVEGLGQRPGQDSAVEATSGSPRPVPSFISAASARRTRAAEGGSLR